MTPRRSRVVWPFLVFFGAVAAPFCNALLSLRIPLLRTESAVILAALAAVALLAALAMVRLPRFVQALLYTVTILCFIDVAYSGNRLATSASTVFQWFAGERAGRLLAIAVFLVCVYGVVHWLAANAAMLIGVVIGAILLSTVLLQGLSGGAQQTLAQSQARPGAVAGPASDKPVVVVLLLDEMMAVGAMPDAGAPAELAALKQRIFRFHEKYGFRLHTRAYSRHYWTEHSIPDLLNFNYQRTSKKPLYTALPDANHKVLRLTENRLFREFAARGNAIEVFQTDHVHFCDEPGVTFCATLDSYNPLSEYTATTPVERRRIVIGAALRAVADSYVVNTLLGQVALLREITESSPPRIDVQAFKPWFAGIKQRILSASPGTLIFAHVMVPHAPYMLNEDCSVTFNWINPYRLAESPGTSGAIEAAYRENYRRYFRQVNCLFSELEDLFEQAGTRPELRNATFVINGDHGSRISKSNLAGNMDQRDLTDNYAAHFAVKAPAVAPGIDPAFRALQRLFAEAFNPTLRSARISDEEGSVLADVKGESEFARIPARRFEPAAP